MKKESVVLNLFCILAAIGLLGLAALNAITSNEFLTTDNLFLTLVCLVLALMFAANPLLSLKASGKLSLPSLGKSAKEPASLPRSPATPALPAASQPMLDAKGRPMPADVRAIVTRLEQAQRNDS
jgi:hypothetical protein